MNSTPPAEDAPATADANGGKSGNASDTYVSGLDRLRKRVRARVRLTDLKAVAREAGMSPSAMRRFLAGGPLSPRVHANLFGWLFESDLEAQAISVARVENMEMFLDDLPADRKVSGMLALLKVLNDQFDPSQGDSVPLWLARLTRQVEGYARDWEESNAELVRYWADAHPSDK